MGGIQAPLQVNALNIEYAKTSKNIDVRRLKQVIWSLLCNDSNKVIVNPISQNHTLVPKNSRVWVSGTGIIPIPDTRTLIPNFVGYYTHTRTHDTLVFRVFNLISWYLNRV